MSSKKFLVQIFVHRDTGELLLRHTGGGFVYMESEFGSSSREFPYKWDLLEDVGFVEGWKPSENAWAQEHVWANQSLTNGLLTEVIDLLVERFPEDMRARGFWSREGNA